jgi:putative flavoprotein involved in K+ transport
VPRTNTVIIGGGQAGLALSHCLSALAIDHVVMERGKLAQRWRSQSWDSLRLLTPNWMTRLPGFHYDGDDGDGFMSIRELVAFFERYAATFRPPLLTETSVHSVDARSTGFRVGTSGGSWVADSVVVATGSCDVPFVPDVSRRLAPSITQIVPAEYRRPERLPAGGVLVVGASATGVQLADEIQRSGRQVTLAVGNHTRLPRSYRGHDILWWLDRAGILDRRVGPESRQHRRPSLQLVGKPDHSSLDLATLHESGVRFVGRVQHIDGHRVRVADDLGATTAAADIKMGDLLTRIDQHIARHGFAAPAPEAFRPTWPLASATPEVLDLKVERITTVVWATGYRRAFPWLRVPVLDAHGEIAHVDGETRMPGLYVLGFNFQRRLNSSFIDGVGADASVIAGRIARSIPRAGAAQARVA